MVIKNNLANNSWIDWNGSRELQSPNNHTRKVILSSNAKRPASSRAFFVNLTIHKTYHDDSFNVSALSKELKELFFSREERHVADVQSRWLLQQLLLVGPGAFEVLIAVRTQVSQGHFDLTPSKASDKSAAVTYDVKFNDKRPKIIFSVFLSNVNNNRHTEISRNATAWPKLTKRAFQFSSFELSINNKKD